MDTEEARKDHNSQMRDCEWVDESSRGVVIIHVFLYDIIHAAEVIDWYDLRGCSPTLHWATEKGNSTTNHPVWVAGGTLQSR